MLFSCNLEYIALASFKNMMKLPSLRSSNFIMFLKLTWAIYLKLPQKHEITSTNSRKYVDNASLLLVNVYFYLEFIPEKHI